MGCRRKPSLSKARLLRHALTSDPSVLFCCLPGTRAAAFGLLLHDESAAHKGHRERQAPPRGYGAVFAPGPAPGTLEATLFEDTGVGACGLTSLSPPPRPGSCKLVFKVGLLVCSQLCHTY